ncbi:MAG TPA: efflux transporter outer membrane subunit, partial [Reyranella sp.]|nr:efflux transporter outer membrane subunit [Reyranella sp.]
MRRAPLAALLALGGSTLGGCMMGPDFRSPDPPRTGSYLAEGQPAELVAANIPGGEAQRIVQDLDIPGQWWAVFQSRPLDDLIRRALVANPDIHAAAAALRAAQFTARAQRATLYPTVQAGFSAAQNQTSNVLSSPTASGEFVNGLFTMGLTITYTLDLFGANRRAAESFEALAEAQCFQLEAAYLSLASNVVAAAILEASLRAQIESTQRIVAAQRETLGILRQQEGLGAITGADVAQQEAALAQAEATLPPLQKALAQQRNLLATLTGRLPSAAVAERFELSDLTLPQDLPLSLPSRLVEQRPDIRAAEANLHSAGAQLGVATANQFPQITLSAGINTTSLTFDQLFLPGLTGSTVGASILQTVLDGGALWA